MYPIISWAIIIAGLLFTFEIPQKIYYAIKKHGNKIEEVRADERDYYRDDINND